MSTNEYHPEATDSQKTLQDAINKWLEEQMWASMAPMGILKIRVNDKFLRGNRHNVLWERVTTVSQIPPVIRILPND